MTSEYLRRSKLLAEAGRDIHSRAHTIDIESIVLDGIDPRRVAHQGALLESAIARALGPGVDAGIARETASAVMTSVSGAADGI